MCAEIRAVFEKWDVGPGTTLICGGARGADLIAAEQARALGAAVVLCLAQPPEEFVMRSVNLTGSNWAERFESARESAAEVRLLADERPTVTHDIHAATNRWMIELASERASDVDLRAVLVWNGERGRAGGTRDFVHQLGIDGPDDRRIAVIDPTPRAYEDRQRSTTSPKRLLALDGGGVRGLLSLEILRELEVQLGRWYDDRDLRLADYFDYIGGTSTGAVLAAALAGGRHTAADLLDPYERLARSVFTGRLPHRFRPLDQHEPLDDDLTLLLGDGRTLGDPELRSLLLLVFHDAERGSVWPLSNNTAAPYNRADRCLLDVPDRHLDLQLSELVRGSTAGPLHFAPAHLTIGSGEKLFEDGGITPFNNPAMLMYVMATSPVHRLGWRSGADDLLIVSVGTGASTVEPTGPTAPPVADGSYLDALPSLLMAGSSAEQDMMCRLIGRCRHGPTIEREPRTPLRGDAGAAFTYVRYEADLTDDALAELGVLDASERARARMLDAVDEVATLRRVGAHSARDVSIERHLEGFLGPLERDRGA